MVYLFLADGFEEIEALTQVDYLRRAGIEILTVGVTGTYVTGTRNIVVKADRKIDEVNYTDDLEMVVMPGGLGGTKGMKDCKKVIEIIESAYENNKYVAAICAAPTILAQLGLLDGKKCTCYPDMQHILSENGGIVMDTAVVKDGKIITARGAGASEEFSFELITALRDKASVEQVRHGICAR